MRENTASIAKRLRADMAHWSLAHFIFDACLTVFCTAIIGWVLKMPWWLLLLLAACLFGAIWSGWSIFAQRKVRHTREERMRLEIHSYISTCEDLTTEEQWSVWLTSTISGLDGLLGWRESEQFWKQIPEKEGDLQTRIETAKQYLGGVAASLKTSGN